MITTYLTFKDNTEEAFNFYKSALGGEINLQRFGDTPHGEEMSEQDKKKVMHAELKGPNGLSLMASDHIDSMGVTLIAGNNFSLSLHPENEKDADRIFESLSKGGNVTMPLQKTFWGAYFGMLTDKFGIQWMINCQLKN